MVHCTVTLVRALVAAFIVIGVSATPATAQRTPATTQKPPEHAEHRAGMPDPALRISRAVSRITSAWERLERGLARSVRLLRRASDLHGVLTRRVDALRAFDHDDPSAMPLRERILDDLDELEDLCRGDPWLDSVTWLVGQHGQTLSERLRLLRSLATRPPLRVATVPIAAEGGSFEGAATAEALRALLPVLEDLDADLVVFTLPRCSALWFSPTPIRELLRTYRDRFDLVAWSSHFGDACGFLFWTVDDWRLDPDGSIGAMALYLPGCSTGFDPGPAVRAAAEASRRPADALFAMMGFDGLGLWVTQTDSGSWCFARSPIEGGKLLIPPGVPPGENILTGEEALRFGLVRDLVSRHELASSIERTHGRFVKPVDDARIAQFMADFAARAERDNQSRRESELAIGVALARADDRRAPLAERRGAIDRAMAEMDTIIEIVGRYPFSRPESLEMLRFERAQLGLERDALQRSIEARERGLGERPNQP